MVTQLVWNPVDVQMEAYRLPEALCPPVTYTRKYKFNPVPVKFVSIYSPDKPVGQRCQVIHENYYDIVSYDSDNTGEALAMVTAVDYNNDGIKDAEWFYDESSRKWTEYVIDWNDVNSD